MKPSDPTAAKLLRWYPRAWRERYGEEFLAMVEDTLDGGHPTWRLRVSVARAGLRERGHRARLTGQKTLLRSLNRGWGTFLVAGFAFSILPDDFRASPSPARAWKATAVLDAVVALAVFGGAAILAGGLLALPAFGRFLRTGGWPQIRRRVAWTAATTAPAGGGLAALILVSGTETYDRVNGSWAYSLGLAVTTLLLAVTLGLWASAATTTAKRLGLSPRVRAAEKVLATVAAAAMSATVYVNSIWLSAVQGSASWLFFGLGGLAVLAASTTFRLRLAVRRGRRLRTKAARGR